MSWLGGYNPTKKSTTEAESREDKRKKLEAEKAERLDRAKKRVARQIQLQDALNAQREADKACQELLSLAEDIFGEDFYTDAGDEDSDIDIDSVIMTDFDKEDGTDGKGAMSELKGVQCPFMKDDIEYWFRQLEGQLEIIEVKSQWLKRLALQRFLPVEIQSEVKSLFTLTKTAAGNDIYLRIKKELVDLFGQKPEDAYTRAKNRVLVGKPSQLGKLLIDDLCKKDKKLDGCCCADIVWGMFREALPVVVRNHIAQKSFNKDTYKEIFKIADNVWDSNQAPEPLPTRQVAAASAEVAAVQKSQGGQSQKNKGQGGGKKNKGQKNKNNKDQKDSPAPAVNEENLCRIHAKWKKEANFCAAPWACKMKNDWKAPQ